MMKSFFPFVPSKSVGHRLGRRFNGEPTRQVSGCAVALFVVSILAGCTLRQYEISGAELQRLARTDPAERGRRVQVLQQTAYDRDDLDETRPAANGAGVWFVGAQEGQRRRRGNATGQSGSGNGSDASELAAAAAVVLVVTGVVLMPIAVTEGVRHDGFATLSEDQALYLVGADCWVRLGDLTPQDARASVRAVVPGWGGRVDRLERRPLDRVGLGYTLELGGGALPLPERERLPAYGGRLQLGGHPSQQLGVFVGGQFAYGSAAEDSSFLGKLFGEVEFFPAALGIFHAGLFAEGGYAHFVHSRDTNTAVSGAYFSAGPAFQLALSTRLALTLRGGMSSIATDQGRAWVPEASFGVAVY